MSAPRHAPSLSSPSLVEQHLQHDSTGINDAATLSTISFNSALVGPDLSRFDYSPSFSPSPSPPLSASPSPSPSPSLSSRSLPLSLSGPTPTPSRPLSLFDSQAPTRVGSPAPSFKDKEKEYDEEKGNVEEQETKEERQEDEFGEEGGVRGWMTLAGSTMVLCCTFGLSNSFATFLSYYKENQLSTYPTSALSMIGSVHLFITFASAFSAGVLFDRGFFQYQLFFGSVGWLAGFFGLSFAKTYAQIFCCQSLVMGLSLGLMFSPCLSILATYFRRQRAFVVGLAASGVALGAVVFPILLSNLFESHGFAYAIRAAGYVMLGLLGGANLLMRQKRRAGSTEVKKAQEKVAQPPLGPLLKKISRDKAAWLVCSGVFCIYTCCFIPLFYVVSFAKAVGGDSSTLAQYSLSIINAVAFFSRILCGIAADRVGTFNMALPLAIAVAALTFGMIGCTSTGPLVAFLCLFGAAQGGWISVSTTCFMVLAEGKEEMGLRGGIGFLFVAFAVLIGSPIAGALLSATGGSYVAALCFGGGTATLGCGLLAAGRGVVVRKRGTNWV